MLRKFTDIKDRIEKLKDKLESDDIEGPIPLLEEASELMSLAIEEYENYESDSSDEYQDDENDDE